MIAPRCVAVPRWMSWRSTTSVDEGVVDFQPAALTFATPASTRLVSSSRDRSFPWSPCGDVPQQVREPDLRVRRLHRLVELPGRWSHEFGAFAGHLLHGRL